MNRLTYLVPVISLAAFSSQAELSNTTTTVSASTNEESSLTIQQPTSSLQINTRSEDERIEFLLSVADAYFKEEDFEAAVNAYERILEIDPEHSRARYVVAHVYINAKEYTKAENLLMELLEDKPDDFTLKNNLAWLYATA